MAVTVAPAFLASLIPLGFDLLGRLSLEHLVQHPLRQPGQAIVTHKQPLQNLALYGNLVWGHL